MINSETFDYILRNYSFLLTKEEKDYILFNIRNQKKIRDSELSKKNIEFQDKLVLRVLSLNQVQMNYCPICGTLARTINAKSAKCGHTWY